jgi:2-haloacid dehalogenase
MIPSALTLDFYGTVVGGDDAVIAHACRRIEASIRSSASAADIARSWGERFARACEGTGSGFTSQRVANRESLAEVLASVGSPEDPDLLTEALIAYWRRPPLPDDARDFLRRANVPVCLVSNIDRANLEAALSHHGLVFDHVVTSDDVKAYKPAPRCSAERWPCWGWTRTTSCTSETPSPATCQRSPRAMARR